LHKKGAPWGGDPQSVPGRGAVMIVVPEVAELLHSLDAAPGLDLLDDLVRQLDRHEALPDLAEKVGHADAPTFKSGGPVDDDDDDDDDGGGGGGGEVFLSEIGVMARDRVLVVASTEHGIANEDLQRLVTFCDVPHFSGVFSSDQLPHQDRAAPTQFCLIFNMSEARFAGTHFVAVVVSSQKVYYLDPTGLPPIQRNVVNALYWWSRENTKRVVASPAPLQHPSSHLCGVYALYFLLRASRPRDAARFALKQSRLFRWIDETDREKHETLLERNINALLARKPVRKNLVCPTLADRELVGGSLANKR